MTNEEDVIQEFKRTKDEVMWLLETFPLTRNYDFYLVLQYMRRILKAQTKCPQCGHEHDLWLNMDDIKAMDGKMNTLWRMRQKIQNEEELYLPTDPEIIIKRRQREIAIRKGILKV